MESLSLTVTPRVEFSDVFTRREDFLQGSADGLFLERLPDLRVMVPPRITARLLNVKGQFFPVLILAETEELFVARTETESFSATGQGATEEEALADVQSAIELLLEEEANPSEDLPWPEDFR